ncbi:GNAT family N-acetyltransferase [Luteibacter aegosomatis]|uniref:GNAT family N-acetyltransferase n=1 Tax=Luteibacter aegosomatis TaxID=2911537 RepID=UPI001FFA7D8F|nr:GNAT family N-acetyltransferase [Luteibacter aegosomatis]UPG84060.1 GNAT family N-acetyltransferase [Luteibacter aegosomatis]
MEKIGTGSRQDGTHPLDKVVWNALTGEQSRFAIGDDRVRRYLPTIAPFAAMVDASQASLDTLNSLITNHGPVAFSTTDEIPALPELVVARHAMLVQMVWQGEPISIDRGEYVELTDGDVADMADLATETQPGPFGLRTVELGNYRGVRRHGRLAAMAGERMRIGGYTEISAVCVAPAFRGQGFARGLMRSLTSEILARGETPFLHVLKSNQGAISLYRELGFIERIDMHLTVIDKRPE